VLATAGQVLHWTASGLKESAAMLWMTWWPLVFGFTLSGLVQSFLPRNALRAQLGETSPATLARASILGVISSSCSYAASAMSRALFARGASWTNAVVFMLASTNLVIELGVVLYLLLGWQFVVAQIAGGLVMIILLALSMHLVFSRSSQDALRARVLAEAPPASKSSPQSWRSRLRDRRNYQLAAQFTLGDLTMLRRELAAGFLVAGFLIVHVPTSWWAHLFMSGHGSLSVLENVVVAPLLAVVSFVCSVGNIPLAAALWSHGVAFGGVVSFIFADLITLPLLLIYRRFYGTRSTLRLFALLWFVMSAGGLVINALFASAHLLPVNRHTPATSGNFSLGWTLILNIVASAVLLALWLAARRAKNLARDPICGMTVDLSAPVAVRQFQGRDVYFCSLRCAERFDRDEMRTPDSRGADDDCIDPVCQMHVSASDSLSAQGSDGTTYYFCGEGCRQTFLASNSTVAPSTDTTGTETTT
jgi:uncharacterized membrane protein YraQ (UPF0718 family)/YHS domain-containing protein